MLWERFLFVVISECFTEVFTASYTFFLLNVDKWVAAGRRLQGCRPSACMSKHELHFGKAAGYGWQGKEAQAAA